MEWNPFAACTLAVGQKSGVCLWRIVYDQTIKREPGEDGTMPLFPKNHSGHPHSWMQELEVPGYKNVSSLAWSPDGRFLVVGYEKTPTLVIWDDCLLKYEIVSRGRYGTKLLEFSHDSNRLVQIM